MCFGPCHAHLVIIVKINPSSKTSNDSSPLLGVGHDNLATSAVVFGDTNLLNSLATAHTEFFLELVVDDLLDGHTVGVPAKTTLHMVSLHRPVTRDNVLDGGCQQMAVVRGTGSERRTIVESVRLLLRRQFELSLESIDLLRLGISHGGLTARKGRDGRTVH